MCRNYLYIFVVLQFLIAGSTHAESSAAQFQSPPVGLQNPMVMGKQYVHLSGEYTDIYDPSGRLRAPAEFMKRQKYRTTIAAIGVTILIPLSLFFVSLSGTVFDKTLTWGERKKGIKWLVLGVLSMWLSSYWDVWAPLILTVFMGP